MDEIKLAHNLDIYDFSILIPTAFIGLLVAFYIIFKYIPYNQRFTFIVSGLIGGILGFYFWLILFGKFILSLIIFYDNIRYLIFNSGNVRR